MRRLLIRRKFKMTPLYISICRAPLHMANLCINSTEFAKVSELAKTCKNLTSIMHIMSLSSPLSLFLTENTFLLLDTMYPLNLSIHIYSNHIYSIQEHLFHPEIFKIIRIYYITPRYHITLRIYYKIWLYLPRNCHF